MLVVIALCVVSCTDTASRYNKEINNAERLMQTNADSAMAILDHIDPTTSLYHLKARKCAAKNRELLRG